MPALLLLAALAGGWFFVLLFDRDAPPSARTAMGVPVGLAFLGLFGFVSASALGMGPAALVLAGTAVLWPIPVVLRLRPRRPPWAWPGSPWLAAGFALLAAVLWRVYDRAMFLTPAGIGTGDDHNLGDLPFHIGIVMGFAEGHNYPPQHPELAGTRLTYPFLVDMVSALLVRAGASLQAAFFWPGLLLALALVVLLYHWAWRLSRDRLAAMLAPVLVLFSGGLGWTLLIGELETAPSAWEWLARLPHDYTISPDGGLRWGNAVTTLLVPQRSLLLGLPLSVLIWSWWWRAVAPGTDERTRERLMLGAGLVAGLLPLSHAHSFALALALGGLLALLFPHGRAWARFFLPALALAAPVILWSARGSALQTRAFLGWHLGWDHGESHPLWFWLYNTGLFLPLLLVALARHRQLLPPPWLRFYLPFTLCFIVPNLVRLSPWIWDNVKFLFYWFVASTPLVALVCARLARGPVLARVAAPAVLLALVLAGALDVWRMTSGSIAHRVFDADAVAFGRDVARATPPRSVIAAWPAYDSPVLLSGRPGLLGYTGHIWSQGLHAGSREQELEQLYAGRLDPAVLRERYGVAYVMIGPQERARMGPVPPAWATAPPAAERGPYRLVLLAGREGPPEQE